MSAEQKPLTEAELEALRAWCEWSGGLPVPEAITRLGRLGLCEAEELMLRLLAEHAALKAERDAEALQRSFLWGEAFAVVSAWMASDGGAGGAEDIAAQVADLRGALECTRLPVGLAGLRTRKELEAARDAVVRAFAVPAKAQPVTEAPERSATCKQGCGREALEGLATCGGCTEAGSSPGAAEPPASQIIDLFEALKKALEKKP